jgi:hypothetical protein
MRHLTAWLLAMVVVACGPVRERASLAPPEFELIDEVAQQLSPQTNGGLEFPCHAGQIVWLDLRTDGREWTLTSVDESGRVGRWTARGLEFTWTLSSDQLAHIDEVNRTLRGLEELDSELNRVEIPPLIRSCEQRLCSRTALYADIAPRDERRWIAAPRLDHDPVIGYRRLAGAGRWFAVGDGEGNLAVARVAAKDPASMWRAPTCERLAIGTVADGQSPDSVESLDLFTLGFLPNRRTAIRHIDFGRGTQAIVHSLAPGYSSGMAEEDIFGEIAYLRSQRLLLVSRYRTVYFGRWIIERIALDERGASHLLGPLEKYGVEIGQAWAVLNQASGSALIPATELDSEDLAATFEPGWRTISANDRWLLELDGETVQVYERVGGHVRELQLSQPMGEKILALSNAGTVAVYALGVEARILELFEDSSQAQTLELPANVVDLKYTNSPKGGEILWIELGNGELWRVTDGALRRHEIPGVDRVRRAHVSSSGTLLVFDDEHGLGIQRLEDDAVLRISIYDSATVMSAEGEGTSPSAVGLGLVWRDASTTPRCRFDGSGFDHVARSEPRVARAADLLNAFTSGWECPVEAQ